MGEQKNERGAWTYFFLCFLLWVIVDFGTAGGFNPVYFATYMPALLIFYIGYPLVFTFFIFKLKWKDRKLFIATLVSIFVVEVVFVHNPLLITFPVLLIGIPLAILIYAPLTYFPLWYVRGELRNKKKLVRFLTIVEVVVMLLTVVGGTGKG